MVQSINIKFSLTTFLTDTYAAQTHIMTPELPNEETGSATAPSPTFITIIGCQGSGLQSPLASLWMVAY